MVYSPFDFNEASRHRTEYVENNLRDGSPVVGVSFDGGLLLLTVRQTQRKVFEVYDRLIFSAIGKQADIEAVRIGAIDVAHREGFERSPDDVTIQRLVGFSLSPPLKRLFGDQFNAPAVIRALFGELGQRPEEDLFFVLNYDGEFSQSNGFGVVAGTPEAEDRMALWLMGVGGQTTREQALERALKAWAVGAMETRRRKVGADEEENPLRDIDEGEQLTGFLREELKTSQVEVGVLERNTSRESKFRLFTGADLEGLLRDYR
jgi:proteasome alpha subunit